MFSGQLKETEPRDEATTQISTIENRSIRGVEVVEIHSRFGYPRDPWILIRNQTVVK